MKILGSNFTAYNRQITEAVKINRNKSSYLLNSKAEYNRSSLSAIKTSERKCEWEKSDLKELEIKEAIEILEIGGKKLERKLFMLKKDKRKEEEAEVTEKNVIIVGNGENETKDTNSDIGLEKESEKYRMKQKKEDFVREITKRKKKE